MMRYDMRLHRLDLTANIVTVVAQDNKDSVRAVARYGNHGSGGQWS